MLKKVFLLTVVVLLGACGSATEEPIRDLLTEEQMVDILIDVRIAEGQVNSLSIKKDSADILYKYIEDKIFLEHEIDSVKYLQSYEYYMRNPDLMLRITDIVIDSLKVRQQRLTAPKTDKN